MLLYSGKFLRVQNFVELPRRAFEKIFAGLIFAALTRTGRQDTINIAIAAIFAVFIFTEADLSAKITKFCTTRKFPAMWYTAKWNVYRYNGYYNYHLFCRKH